MSTYRLEARPARRQRERIFETSLQVLLPSQQQRSNHPERSFSQLNCLMESAYSLRTTPIPQLNTSDVFSGSAVRSTLTYASR